MDDKSRRIRERLDHIVEWSGRIEVYLEGTSLEDFRTDLRTQDAVIRCIEVVGEASNRIRQIDSDLSRKYPELCLEEAYRARNRLAHGYEGIDLALIWDIAVDFIPGQATAVKRFLKEQYGNSN